MTVSTDTLGTPEILEELRVIREQLPGADAAVKALRGRRDALILTGYRQGLNGRELGEAAGFSSHRRVSQILEAAGEGEPRDHSCRVCGAGPFSLRGRGIHESLHETPVAAG